MGASEKNEKIANFIEKFFYHWLLAKMSTITLTFGNCAENHRGMEIMGKHLEEGLGLEELVHAKEWFEGKGVKCELVHLNHLIEGKGEEAFVLIARNGVNAMLGEGGSDVLFAEQNALKKDSKAFMYGRVVEKHARHNLCFYDYEQKADFENKKGTIVKYDDVANLKKLREMWGEIFASDKVKGMPCEGNYYYDVERTYIGWHSDNEREVVVAIRLGADFNLYYSWYLNGEKIGKMWKTTLHHGDVYAMSSKAVGYDGRKKKIPILRHAAAWNEKWIMKEKKPKRKVEGAAQRKEE
jgi:hypothetical protein